MADLPKKPEENEEKPHPLTVALKFATYPIAAMAAYFVGRTEVRKGIYKNFVSAGAFKDLQPPHRNELCDIITQSGQGHPINGPALAEATNNTYRLAVKEKFEKAGFHNIVDYWRGLHPNQKINAVMFAAGTAGIVITTSLAVINNKKLLEKLGTKDHEETATPESIPH